MPYTKGSWTVVCDVCGWEFPQEKIKKRWDGLLVCNADFEVDHPQKYLRLRSDPTSASVGWIRPEEDVFIELVYHDLRNAAFRNTLARASLSAVITDTTPT